MSDTARKISKCDQICSFLRIWLHLLKKSVMENFIFCSVWYDDSIQKFICFNLQFWFNIMVWVPVTVACIYTPFSLTMGVSFFVLVPLVFSTCFIIFHAISVPDFGIFIHNKSSASRAWLFWVPRLLLLVLLIAQPPVWVEKLLIRMMYGILNIEVIIG